MISSQILQKNIFYTSHKNFKKICCFFGRDKYSNNTMHSITSA